MATSGAQHLLAPLATLRPVGARDHEAFMAAVVQLLCSRIAPAELDERFGHMFTARGTEACAARSEHTPHGRSPRAGG